MPTTVAGVDGCKTGWLCVRVDASSRLRILEIAIAPTFEVLLEQTSGCDAVAVDVPIGLSDSQPRQADTLARKAMGPRRSSVFPAPLRGVLDVTTYTEACDISEKASGKKLSQQAFAILPKIREVDAGMSPPLQDRILEVHPKVSFWTLNGERTLNYWKRKREGAAERTSILEQAFADDVSNLKAPKGSGIDDLYDAMAAAWTAGRVAYGTERRLPPDPETDSRGLRMEIVY